MPNGDDNGKEGDFDKLARRLIAGQASAGYIQKLIAGLINKGVHLLPENVQMQILRKISVNPGLRAVSADFPESWRRAVSDVGGGALARILPPVAIAAGFGLAGNELANLTTGEDYSLAERLSQGTRGFPTHPRFMGMGQVSDWKPKETAAPYDTSHDVPLPPQALFAGTGSQATGRPFQIPQQAPPQQSVWANLGSKLLPLVRKKVTRKTSRSAGRIYRR